MSTEREFQERLAREQKESTEAAKAAQGQPWWERFVKLAKDRRQGILEDLALKAFTGAEERGFYKGRANELNWVILLDQAAKNELAKEKADAAERQRQTRAG